MQRVFTFEYLQKSELYNQARASKYLEVIQLVFSFASSVDSLSRFERRNVKIVTTSYASSQRTPRNVHPYRTCHDRTNDDLSANDGVLHACSFRSVPNVTLTVQT